MVEPGNLVPSQYIELAAIFQEFLHIISYVIIKRIESTQIFTFLAAEEVPDFSFLLQQCLISTNACIKGFFVYTYRFPGCRSSIYMSCRYKKFCWFMILYFKSTTNTMKGSSNGETLNKILQPILAPWLRFPAGKIFIPPLMFSVLFRFIS